MFLWFTCELAWRPSKTSLTLKKARNTHLKNKIRRPDETSGLRLLSGLVLIGLRITEANRAFLTEYGKNEILIARFKRQGGVLWPGATA